MALALLQVFMALEHWNKTKYRSPSGSLQSGVSATSLSHREELVIREVS